MLVSDPLADFVHRTLAEIPTLAGKILYCAYLLRQGKGRYDHWGVERKYGVEVAQSAMTCGHTDVMAKWLTSSLLELVDDVTVFCDLSEIGAEEALEALGDVASVPLNLSEMRKRHFQVSVGTLRALLRVKAQRAA